MFHFPVAAIKKLMIEHYVLAYTIPVIWMEPVSTNINHKGLQRTANEYAEERRIYKDLWSAKMKSKHIKFCKQNTTMLIVLRKN